VPILNPDHVRRAAYTADAWDIDTDRLMSGYARTARRHGAQIVTHAPVAQITRTEGGWRVRAGSHEIAARILINAAGAWADAVATLAGRAPMGIQPFRRSMARIVAPGRHDTRAWPMLFGPGEAWYAKPDAGALLVSPAEEDPLPPQDAWAEDLVIAEGLARYQAHVTIPVTRPTTTWAGLRSFAPDRQLVIGPDPDDPAFFWLAGQGGYGMQSSPAAGRLTADLLAGRTPELDAATLASLNPARFS
ncbi:MAG: FAD-binding oxidoreductase, partial [Pseudomonadota bacterium]